MRKLFTIVIYTGILLLVGRNLSFLPEFSSTPSLEEPRDTTAIKRALQKFTITQPGSYSISYQDFTTPTTLAINEKQIYTAASVNKVPIVAALYHLAEKAELDLNDKIVIQEEDIQDYGTGSLRYQEPGKAYSLKTLAKLTLEQSDNTAARVLANRIGMDTIQNMVDTWGLTQTNMEKNTSSLADMRLLFTKIYNHELTNPALTEELLDFLKDTDFEDRLAREIPKDTSVYHKIGDTVGGVHDVGIIEKDNQAFFIGVMTSDIGDSEEQTKETIGKIAKALYDFHFINR